MFDYLNTRMHSNGMRTARLLTISQHALLRGDCAIPACTGQGDVCIPACTGQGSVFPGGVYPGVSAQGDFCPGGCCLGGGVCLRGVYPGVSAQGCLPGGCLPLVLGVCGRNPPLNRMTDRCKNISLLQLCCGR